MNGNAVQTAYNYSLARLLRHEGLNAEGEQKRHFGTRLGWADVLLDFDDYAVVIEARFVGSGKADFGLVKEDAEKRFPDGTPAVVNGLPVRLVVAVGYPVELQNLPESQSDVNLATRDDLIFAYRYFGEAWHEETVGSVAGLAEVLRDYWVQSDNGIGIEEVVQRAAKGISDARDILARVEPEDTGEQDGPSTKALIWLNAMLFQELLARHLDTSLLPPEHRSKRILRPDPEQGPHHLVEQWIEILKINWWPIFHIAKETLKTTPGPANQEAVSILKRTAAEIAETGAIRRHDVAGRIFHRLLDSRKFLATNYTTIPAAIILAGLTFDERSECWSDIDFSDPESIAGMRILDPACGSGTLLMAAVQEALKRARRACPSTTGEQRERVIRAIVESAVYGFDVVPAAIHLAASTLCMAEARQVIQDMNLWRLRHDVEDGVSRLGSLDFLSGSPSQGNAARLPLFDEEASVRVTGRGEEEEEVAKLHECHLVLANPPFTRAGGPGDQENTRWNPIFGSLLDKADSRKMQGSLRKMLKDTPASLYAGLASAFILLADECLSRNGRLAFVLPTAMLTGSGWRRIRRLLLNKYCIDWVIVSHDLRHRNKMKELPGRLWVSFSESTRMAEVLLIATKNRDETHHNHVRFVNLRHNPDEPVQAMALVRKLIAMDEEGVPLEARGIDVGSTNWGSLVAVPQKQLSDGVWSYAAFLQPDLVVTAMGLSSGKGPLLSGIPITKLGSIADLGPYHLQIRGTNQGLFHACVTDEPLRSGIPSIWHHDSTQITTLDTKANARLELRGDRDRLKQKKMLEKASCLQMASDLRIASQRVAAVLTEKPMLGIRSWITLKFRNSAPGKAEAQCLWLNSTPGLLLRIVHANQSYLGRPSITHELAKTMPVLDVEKLSEEQLEAAISLYESLQGRQLQGFGGLEGDLVRLELNARLCEEVLGIESADIEELTHQLAKEPTMRART